MSESGDRGRRPGGKPASGRPSSGRPSSGRPTSGRPERGTPRAGRPAQGADGRPQRSGNDEKRLWTRAGAPARGDRSAREREAPVDRDPYGTQSVRSRHDDPVIAEDVKPGDLDRVARAQLKTLSKENAEGVANHLVMVARLIDSDPQLAHKHAISAARRAGRIAVVRETLAITAYTIGDYSLALRELRTYRRISGRNDQLPMMVDSERGLNRPDRALELGRSVERSTLPVDVQVELAIAMSGARLDLGQPELALGELEIAQLDPTTAYSYSPGLFDAYATVLEDLGRLEDAELWWERSNRASEALSSAATGDDDVVEVVEEEVADGGAPAEATASGDTDVAGPDVAAQDGAIEQ
ncbi:hypothetical protein [Parafrigoribacterium soli]|uniref:hypothetical protein n=1 Tax=Parafrigoribacterium soli TaxID=3144663 RepID=UPI0032EC2A96